MWLYFHLPLPFLHLLAFGREQNYIGFFFFWWKIIIFRYEKYGHKWFIQQICEWSNGTYGSYRGMNIFHTNSLISLIKDFHLLHGNQIQFQSTTTKQIRFSMATLKPDQTNPRCNLEKYKNRKIQLSNRNVFFFCGTGRKQCEKRICS